MTHPLDPLFNPRGVAVIGASNRELTIGHRVVTNLVANGYKGGIYPVHPKGAEVLGLKAYKSVTECPGPVDLVNICIRSTYVPQTMRECGEKGVKFAIIHSGGFREMGGEGARLEDEVMEIAEQYGIRVYGPNSQGVMNSDPAANLYANFTFTPMVPGGVSILAQSGGVAEVLNLNLRERGMGFSKYASNGNARDVSIPEILEYFGQDEETKVILLHVESMKDTAPFIETVAKITARKPILAVKSGKTREASKAISSHTGSLMEEDTLSDAIFEKCGIIRFHSMEEMIDTAIAFATQPLPQGKRVGIMTNAGGPGIIAVDECVQRGLLLPELTAESKDLLKEGLPREAYCENPIDTAATAGPPAFAAATKALLTDPNVDALMINMVTPFFVDSPGIAQAIVDEWVASGKKKPVVAVVMTNENWASTLATVKDAGIPTYAFPETAANVLQQMVKYGTMCEEAAEPISRTSATVERARAIVHEAQAAGGGFIAPQFAFELLDCYGIPAAGYRSVGNETELLAAANDLGYPLVLKVESSKVVHRTDSGGVLLNMNTQEELVAGFKTLMDKFSQFDPRVTVQKQMPAGKEMIVGAKREGQLPLIAVGFGGIYVEVLKDVSFALAPLSAGKAERMVKSLKGFALLEGVRGEKAADVSSLLDVVLRVQQMFVDLPDMKELDLNPLIVYSEGEGSFVVDARMKV
jgi:acetate---CoA ligase (ADP-forming)